MKLNIYIIAIILLAPATVFTQFFFEINANLPQINNSSVDWGDYDNDGDLDILLTGYTGSTRISKVYDYENGTFSESSISLPGAVWNNSHWGDFDNDGDLDILLTGGRGGGQSKIAWVYRQASGTFSIFSTNMLGLHLGGSDWGDYDNDDDLDVVITGNTSLGGGKYSKVYNYNNGVYTDIGANIEGLDWSSVDWGDYDNDNDLDIIIAGLNSTNQFKTHIYRNDNGTFNDINAGLTNVGYQSAVKWADLDNDNDLDVIISGATSLNNGDPINPVTKIYRNDSGVFTEVASNLPDVHYGSISCADIDNDNDIDIFISGRISWHNHVSKIFINNGGFSFTELQTDIMDAAWSASDWGDFNGDGLMDLIVSGINSNSGKYTKVYMQVTSIPTLPLWASISILITFSIVSIVFLRKWFS